MSDFEGFESGDHFQRDVRSVLEAQGADLTTERGFHFFLYLPTKETAEAAAKEIRKAGLECVIEEADGGAGLCACLAHGALVPTTERLTAIGDLMLGLAKAHNGLFDGWQAEADVGGTPNYTELATSILYSMQENFAAEHEYAPANPADFPELDLGFYDNTQQKLEALGFVFIADKEDCTITQQGDIRTFIRSLSHPESKTVAAIFYVPTDPAIETYELETLLSDGQFVVNTVSAESFEVADWPKIHVEYSEGPTSVEDLYRKHLEHVARIVAASDGVEPVAVTNYDELVAMQQAMNKYKHDYLAENGWVSEEWLIAQAGGDEELARAVHAEIQTILASVA